MSSATNAQERLDRLREFLVRDPENWALRADVFEAALAAGQLELAAAEVARAVADRPEDPVWLHRRTSLLLAQRRYPEARAELEALRARGIDEPAVLHDLAFVHFREGRLEEAASLLTPLLPQGGDVAGAAWALWLRCQHHLMNLAPGLEALRARLSGGELTADAMGVASLMALDLGDERDADAWSRAALDRRGSQLEALVTRGTLALGARDPSAALAWLGRALEVSPADGRTWSAVAMAKMMAGEPQPADAAFARAVETMPDHIGTWIAWGWCKLVLDQVEGAREVFEAALRIDANFGESHGSLAVALARLGQREAALREIEIARRLDPNGMGAGYAEAALAGKIADPQIVRQLTAMALRRGRARG